MCSLGTWLAFGCHDALIADVHTDRWDLMVGVSTGGRERGERGEVRDLKGRMRRKETGGDEEGEVGWMGRRKGKWSMDGWREK